MYVFHQATRYMALISSGSVNIGNARLYGLEADLNMQGNQFQIAVSILFVTYVLGELPSNLIMKKYVRPSRWIAGKCREIIYS